MKADDLQLKNLISMANQIAENIGHGASDTECAEAIAAHLSRFWARHMKTLLSEYAQRDGRELGAKVRLAVVYLNID